MSNNAIQKELEALREQVAELNRARDPELATNHDPDVSEASDHMQSPIPLEGGQIPDQDSDGSKMDSEKQIQDFIDALEVEIKDTNPMTVLVIFALGVLIGRLLPR